MEVGSIDLAGAAIQMKSAQISEQKDIALLKMSMDANTEIAQMIVNQIAQVNVNMSAASGHIDIGA